MRTILKILFILSVFFFSANFIFAAEKIDINTAPLEDLVKIIHIGEVRALELISLRPFPSLDELVQIKGISKKRIEDIKKQGLAWIGATEPEPVAQPEPENLAESGSPLVYSSGIIINEILPSPEGSDSEEEWIEIFNKNNFEVEISKWKIQDTIGAVTIYTFPEGTKILAKAFLILPRPTTKITLQNSGDTIKLIQPDGNIIDTVIYEKAPSPIKESEQSYSRTSSEWQWSTTLTPGKENIITKPTELTENSSLEVETKKNKKFSDLKNISQAKIDETLPETSNTLIIFLVALSIALCSVIIVLFIKKKIETKE